MAAILAQMQATRPPVAPSVTPARLARELLEMWGEIMRGSGHEVYAVFEELDVSLTHIKTLHALADPYAGAEPSVKDLAERLGLSLAAASRTAEALLRRGWVERREDPHDRRVKRLSITREGRSVIERIEAARLAGLRAWSASLTPAQRETLSAALHDLRPDA